jgi:phosphoribosylanthranilate isomerase
MAERVKIKICGVTSPEDAQMCIDAGADAIGLNFCVESPRYLEPVRAAAIVRAVREQVLTVAVVADASEQEIVRLREQVGFACVQLHGDEPPELLARLLPHAYKAIAVRDPSSIELARSYPGEHVLLDAYAPDKRGGTGRTFNWSLAAELAAERKVTLAGGLNPENVAEAVRAVRPYCVDVASGVESSPGLKQADRVRALVRNALGA